MRDLFFALLVGLLLACHGAAQGPSVRPNVLFIAIDDQNDWVEPLGGHTLARTPNLNRLASAGTTFLNAHCNAPLCNPSRTSLLLGLRPSTTGIYGLAPWFRNVPQWKDRVTLPQHFQANGYRTLGCGKLFHTGPNGPAPKGTPAVREFAEAGNAAGIGIRPEKKLIGPTPMGDNPLMDWGAFAHEDNQKGDYQVASWAVNEIKSHPKDKPFFMGVGFFLPHVPCYIPPKWLDMIPDDDRVLPSVLENDRDDTPRFSWYLHWYLPEPRLGWLQEKSQWRNLCRSYLASTAFVDAQIGRILDALEQAGMSKNTVVVVWGDHGWHLGEKGISGKNSLWERSTRVPLIFAGPGIAKAGRCIRPAELLDIYPTLVELCGIAKRGDLEGISLVPQLMSPDAKRDRPAITTHNQGNHAVRSERWRYIRYADGSEELYEHTNDPNEWTNLAGKKEHAPIIAEHVKWLPKADVAPAPGSQHRVLTYDRTNDEATWEGKVIRRSDPIPK
jgi:arylsulfatase A-like enzyme